MLRTLITGPKKKAAAFVDNPDGEDNALVVATRPLKTFQNTLQYFINSDYGIDMNQDTGSGGTDENVHNGTDNAYWTASDIVGGGKTTFDNTDQNHTPAGTKAVKVDNAPVGDVYQFLKAAPMDCSGYVALEIWIYVDKDWKAGDSISIYGWDTATGLQVGTTLYLQDYFTYGIYDIWQKIVIPLTDFGVLANYTTLDALRVAQVAADGKAPKYYLDDIAFVELGEPIKFSLTPALGTWLHVSSFQMVIVDVYAGTLLNATMPSIPYTGFLGLAKLMVGMIYRRITNGEVITSSTFKQFGDFMLLSNARVTGSGSDGTNTWVSVNVQFTEPVILKAEDEDEMSMTIQDDMSGLLVFRIGAGCKVEQRP